MATGPFGLRLPFLVALVLLAACGGDATEPVGPPAALTAVTQGTLNGVVGSTLTQPLTVRVTDADGRPVSGIDVDFIVSTGGGLITVSPAVAPLFRGSASSIAAAIDTTDANGEARASWTLGTKSGEQAATAAVTGLTTVTFTATAEPDVPADFAIIAASGFIGIAGDVADGPIAVQLNDQFNNGTPGVTVSWASLGGGAAVAALSSTTDSDGKASVDVTLGPTHGLYLFTVTPTGFDPDTIGFLAVIGIAEPVGDSLNPGQAGLVSHDLSFVGGAIVDSLLFLYLRFVNNVSEFSLTGDLPSNSIVGWMDMDMDQDSTTGFRVLRQCLQTPLVGPLGFGADLMVDFDPTSQALSFLQDPPEGMVPLLLADSVDVANPCFGTALVAGTVPIYHNKTITIPVPMSLTQDDGVFDFTSFWANGATFVITDFAPDSLAGTLDLTSTTTTAPANGLPGRADDVRFLQRRFDYTGPARTSMAALLSERRRYRNP